MLWGIQKFRWWYFIYFSSYLNSLISGSVLQSCVNIQNPLFMFLFRQGRRCLLPFSSSLTLSHQNVFFSYKHCHCSEQTNVSFKLIFRIWKWSVLTTSWRSMKHLRLLPTALLLILVIQPYSFHVSFQDGFALIHFIHPGLRDIPIPFA